MKVALYARVSSDKQAKKENSIPMQLEEMRKYAKERGWGICEEYVDEGISAYSGKLRPQYEQMMNDARQKKFDVILVWGVDRLIRKHWGLQLVIVELDDLGIELKSVTEDLENDFSVAWHSLRSHEESKQIGKRVYANLKRIAQSGKHASGRAPFGYRLRYEIEKDDKEKSKKRSHLEIVPEEVEIVKKAYDLYVNKGIGYRHIATIFNKTESIRPNGKEWTLGSVKRIIDNPIYAGKVRWNKSCGKQGNRRIKPKEEWILADGEHKAIVSWKLFEKAEKLRGDRTHHNGKYHPKKLSKTFLLSGGLLKCGLCGQSMFAHRTKNHFHYFCSMKQKQASEACKMPFLKREVIESAILKFFDVRCLDIGATVKQAQKSMDESQKNWNKELTAKQNERTKLTDAREKYCEAFESGTETREGFLSQRVSEIENRLMEIENEIERLNQTIKGSEVVSMDSILDAVNQMRQELKSANVKDKFKLRLQIKEIFNHFTVNVTDEGYMLIPDVKQEAVERWTRVTSKDLMDLSNFVKSEKVGDKVVETVSLPEYINDEVLKPTFKKVALDIDKIEENDVCGNAVEFAQVRK